ncbi:copine VIII, putative [Acanthamoeba castellanii str. Neff]|uniref:Copine VIII, putative n=1 Tax=Acanthamoeba castellanii (strain ATCC 30010 / Neff) TaxID=1257118 RepID=L8GXA8_ACACF|nr:copine VIII, putative [Acanthamoeba castellanii str. Neff]ELR17203.1 copine VIII, putative [Acanthamoeba castellanii str. Neff]
MQVPMSGAFDTTVSKVEIRISCRNLIRLDVLSESDPLVRVEQFDPTTGRWSEVGRTEWQQNQKNPNFARCVPMDYWFEKAQQVQKLRFQVFDIDRPDSSLNSSQDFIGEAVVNLGDILGNKGGTLSRDLQNPHHTSRKNGIIIIRAEEVNADAQNSIVTFRFSGSHLDKKDFFGKSDPYLEIYRNNPADSQWVLVHKTEVIKKTLDPTWRPFEIDASKLCQGDFNRMLMFKVWDWDSDGGHDLIGNATTTLNEMIKGKRQFALIEPDLMRKKRGYKDSGILNVHQVDVRRVHSFLEYIAGGCQLRLALAIDFTASNGNPQDSKSLHYRNPSGEPNEYLKAMMAVGDIVASYDQTKQFPTYGFGAKIPPANEVSHCFHVNMNPSNPECIGIENVIGAYQHALSYVKLSGPTNFGPIIKQVATIARSTPLQQQVYWILLMITDGVISDMERTISEIVDASDLPFSIIIVGVGDADFKDMDNLDSDDRLLRTRTGKTATRDIVQFVPFRDYKRKHYSELARVTLAELPKQLTDYYKAHNIAPNPRPDVPMTQARPAACFVCVCGVCVCCVHVA